MPFSPSLADRVRQALRHTRAIDERRMFGGLAFLLRGNLLVGVRKDSLLVRLGAEAAGRALEDPHVTRFVAGQREMKGWVVVALDGLEGDPALGHWIDGAIEFVTQLPPK
ncbi:MAG TPA: TfoX/Sxy family protein [Pirellulales bacterium]|nr:TfoX/Sxy family protein [Pirellulales bacterium]